MKSKNLLSLIIIILFFSSFISQAQNVSNSAQIHGDIQSDIKLYNADSKMGITDSTLNGEKLRMNTFANIIFTKGNFEAGARFETYQNPILGYDLRYKGTGIPYRYIKYSKDNYEITVGNFYEQFGSGLIFRTYENRDLGYDNSLDGLKVKITPFKGFYIKAVYGKQRYYWAKANEGDRGIVRGIDGELNINEAFKKLENKKTKIILGAGFVSKYQKDQNIISHGDKLDLPKNVGAFSGRMNIIRGRINVMGEYAYKINDPSADNNYIYRKGEALLVQASYAQRGLGIFVGAKRIDNMNFRSDRTAIGQDLNINYLPALTKEHQYTLASMYPYATQPGGEVGFQAQIDYKIKKKTALGGKYGTKISINYSIANALDTTIIASDNIHKGYESDFFSIGDEKYFEDFSILIHKKINKKIKTTFSYVNIVYNNVAVKGHETENGEKMVYANIGIADVSYKLKHGKSLRFEMQSLFTEQDKGDWIMGTVEYNTPKWFVAVMDQYNYGNDIKDNQLHYYTLSTGYHKGATRIAVTYGRQREGIICVGGVCRQVPASNGLGLSLTTSF